MLHSGQSSTLGEIYNFTRAPEMGKLSPWLPFSKKEYSRLDATDRENADESCSLSDRHPTIRVIGSPLNLKTLLFLGLTLGICAGSLGFFAGRYIPSVAPLDFLLGRVMSCCKQIMKH